MAKDGGFTSKYGPWAVVTGASSGIGAEFARQLAARGVAVALVRVAATGSKALAAELVAQHGIEVRVVERDLAAAGGAEA